MEKTPDLPLSVVCTIYRSGEIVPQLVRMVSQECAKCTSCFEIILVDDSSPDTSWLAIEEACVSHPHVRGLRLGRNFGQQLAVAAGLRHSSGEFTIVMDGDLQNPPSAIPEIVAKLKSGVDIVYTTSLSRNSMANGLSSWLFWWVMNKVIKLKVIPNQLMMRGMSKRCVDIFNSYNEHIRNVVGITHDIGLNYDIIKVRNNRRHSGESNYNFFKRFDVMLDVVLLMTNRPLTYLIYGAGLAFMASIILGVLTLINYLRFPEMPAGYTTLVFLISLFGSSTLLILGIIGRYLANIYTEVRNRPLFNIDKKINFNGNP
jgi:dolichol-phosphate mannosyltransferase